MDKSFKQKVRTHTLHHSRSRRMLNTHRRRRRRLTPIRAAATPAPPHRQRMAACCTPSVTCLPPTSASSSDSRYPAAPSKPPASGTASPFPASAAALPHHARRHGPHPNLSRASDGRHAEADGRGARVRPVPRPRNDTGLHSSPKLRGSGKRKAIACAIPFHSSWRYSGTGSLDHSPPPPPPDGRLSAPSSSFPAATHSFRPPSGTGCPSCRAAPLPS